MAAWQDRRDVERNTEDKTKRNDNTEAGRQEDNNKKKQSKWQSERKVKRNGGSRIKREDV